MCRVTVSAHDFVRGDLERTSIRSSNLAGWQVIDAGFKPEDMHGFVTVIPGGFAELALRAHADVIPMTASLGAGGEVCIHLGQPLTPRGADHREQVESLVRQYVASLENHWREDPGSVAWGHLARFLELPLLEEGAGRASAGG